MQSLLEVVPVDLTGPVVVGVLFFGILAAGLGFVRQVGKMRPHSKGTHD
ncbi:MAG: hypothetical protein IPO80_00525 [Propionibacteriaceae bacterium]|nr:hypothetical protein [Propionibacteriaceae bacterium]